MTRDLTKPALRQQLLHQRRVLSAAQWQQDSQQICQHLRSLPLFQQSRTVLAYFSVRQEPDLSQLFQPLSSPTSPASLTVPSLRLPKTWAFPRCIGSTLSWHAWTPGQPLVQGRYGISEPAADAPAVAPEQVDLMLVPCVGCDRRGYRLGHGAGFYDRLLSQSGWATIPTIGIVFQFALLDQLPIDPWDQPLSGICTETGWWQPKLC